MARSTLKSHRISGQDMSNITCEPEQENAFLVDNKMVDLSFHRKHPANTNSRASPLAMADLEAALSHLPHVQSCTTNSANCGCGVCPLNTPEHGNVCYAAHERNAQQNRHNCTERLCRMQHQRKCVLRNMRTAKVCIRECRFQV